MELSKIAVPAVYALIFFLGYPSQYPLFYYLDPAPLTKKELIWANVLLVCIFVTYTQSVFVDPGTIPRKEQRDEKQEGVNGGSGNDGKEKVEGKKGTGQRTKWCRKCDAAKPPRAHHCKECKR
jgi:palmitoyltransferase